MRGSRVNFCVRTVWGAKLCSWMTRKSFACNAGESSAISSKNTVPPSATSNLPALRAIAPVKATRSCPN
jgi:hypothetical protein